MFLEREIEVLRAGLTEDVEPVVAGRGELFDCLLGRDMHDVQRRPGDVREHDRAVGGLLFGLPHPGLAVEVGRGLSGVDELLGQDVDDGPVLGVHHREQARVGGDLHGLKDLRVIRVEDAGVRHEQLVARDAFVDEGRQEGERFVVDAADDLVEPVVDRAVSRRQLVPGGQSVGHLGAVGLHREVDDRGRASPGRGAGAGLERVTREGAAEWQLHVRVGVDAARNDVLAARIDDGVDGCRQVRAEQFRAGREDGDDLLAVDEDIGRSPPGGGDDGAAGDQCRAHGAEIPS